MVACRPKGKWIAIHINYFSSTTYFSNLITVKICYVKLNTLNYLGFVFIHILHVSKLFDIGLKLYIGETSKYLLVGSLTWVVNFILTYAIIISSTVFVRLYLLTRLELIIPLPLPSNYIPLRANGTV